MNDPCVWYVHIGACIVAFTHNIWFRMLFTMITFIKFNIFPLNNACKKLKSFSKSQLGIHTVNHFKRWIGFSECNKSKSLGNTCLVKKMIRFLKLFSNKYIVINEQTYFLCIVGH